MRIGMPLSYAGGGFRETAAVLQEYENAGLDRVLVPEAYSFDGVSQLGYLAAVTERVELCSSILNIYSRTPSLLAMTAAGLDHVSNGRFVLGIGASGPQVIEGFHGVPYDAPIGRTREVADICRSVWRREPVDHHGQHYDVPLTPERGGSGLGRRLKLINSPVRERVPMSLAAMGPKNVELAAEVFEEWEPLFFYPERAAEAFGEPLAAGLSARPGVLPPLAIAASVRLLVTDDPGEVSRGQRAVRQNLALYVGGMGARGRNFYHALMGRFGFAEQADLVQDLYLSGRKDEAADALPQQLVDGLALIGSEEFIVARVKAFSAAGVTTLNATPLASTHRRRLEDVALLVSAAAASGV